MIISCNKVTKSFGATEILKDISFNINEREKVAIVGVNGAGKSTLFKIICNKLAADDGVIAYGKNKSMGFLSQLVDLNETTTIYDNLKEVFKDIIEIENKMMDLEHKMASYSADVPLDLIHEHTKLRETLENKNGYEYRSRIRGVLVGLGFLEDDYYRLVNTLSGGQKRRVSLGKLLLERPDILLLDEPTNHLDIKSIVWLEDFLKQYDGTILMISHDRYFLDKLCNKIIEIENGKSWVFEGNFTDFSIQKEINREIEIKQYLNQQKEVKRQQEIIKVLKSYNREKSIKRAESREKLLAKMNLKEKPEDIPDSMRISLEPNIDSGFDVLTSIDIKKGFDNNLLFEKLNFKVFKGDKIALIGENGIGKTTLFKIILGTLKQDEGEIKLGSNVNIGYYDQEHSTLDDNNTLFDELQNAFPKLTNTQIRNTLAAFVFKNDDALKKVEALSGGEKGRLSLAKIILSKANLLVLDEPTNHLDMYSKEILENAINAYTGTVFYISHDRYFINSTATKIFSLTKNGLEIFEGNYDDYLEKSLNQENNNDIPKNSQMSQFKIDMAKQKELQKLEKKRIKDLKNTELSIEETEKILDEIEKDLIKVGYDNDLTKLQELFIKKEELSNNLEKLYLRWEELSL